MVGFPVGGRPNGAEVWPDERATAVPAPVVEPNTLWIKQLVGTHDARSTPTGRAFGPERRKMRELPNDEPWPRSSFSQSLVSSQLSPSPVSKIVPK